MQSLVQFIAKLNASGVQCTQPQIDLDADNRNRVFVVCQGKRIAASDDNFDRAVASLAYELKVRTLRLDINKRRIGELARKRPAQCDTIEKAVALIEAAAEISRLQCKIEALTDSVKLFFEKELPRRGFTVTSLRNVYTIAW